MSCPLGFEKQVKYIRTIFGDIPTSIRNSAACGAFSFIHISNLYGRTWNIEDAKELLKTSNWWGDGTDEKFIKRAIKKEFGPYVEIWENNKKRAKKKFDGVLDMGIPILVNVDKLSHYMVVASKIGKNYVVIDSGSNQKRIIFFNSWEQLCNRLCCPCQECIGKDEPCDVCDDSEKQYWGLGVKLDKQNKHFQKYSTSGIKNIPSSIDDLIKDRDLQEYWGFYLDHLLDIFDFNLVGKNLMTVSELIEEYWEVIVDIVSYWIGRTKYNIPYELDNYWFVAEFYNLKFYKKDQTEILIDFTTMFALAMADDEWDEDC